jgi:tRNA A37 threonylcarbamoyladenosine dehydratase
MKDNFAERTEIILKKQGIEKLGQASVLVAGIGGVGGQVVEALARAGVGELTLIDCDQVSASNANRQIVALNSTLGKDKVDIMAKRVLDINPDCKVHTQSILIDKDNVEEILLEKNYDCVVDAIDSLTCKVMLLECCYRNNLKVFSSMGAGNKVDATQIKVGDLFDTKACHLARQIRKKIKKLGVGKGITTVYSLEKPLPHGPMSDVSKGRSRVINGTLSYMPAIFGLMLAGEAILYLSQFKREDL